MTILSTIVGIWKRLMRSLYMQKAHSLQRQLYLFHFPSFLMIFKTALVSILIILELSVLHKSCLELNFQANGIIVSNCLQLCPIVFNCLQLSLIGPAGFFRVWCRVMNMAKVNASKPDKHWMGPPGPFSACRWVNASFLTARVS